MIGRFGGEEFIVALPDTHPRDALMVAERLQQKVSELEVMEAMPDHRLTVTVGIAGGLDEDADLDALIQQADRALYAGKHGGRNRVIVSEEVSDEAWRGSYCSPALYSSHPSGPDNLHRTRHGMAGRAPGQRGRS